ncbi:MAG: nitrilase family protein [Muribaculaceae bacterium]|nr:nitrilase family protein [Muribaculaceae bacterium]
MNTGDITIAALPVDIAFADHEANLAAARTMAASVAQPVDIMVLPELFSSGYTNDPAAMHALAEDDGGPAMQTVRHIARTHGCAVAGSFAALENGRYFNRAFLIAPDGSMLARYDKRHLFSMSRDPEVFDHGGHEIPVASFRGWNIALGVCYDLRFPAWLRNRGYAYDLLLMPSNWPQSRAYAFEHLLIARAIENQAAVVGANRGGSDAYGTYDGCTYAFDHLGRPSFAPGTTVARFSLDKLREARTRFPAARDADHFTLTI